MLRHWVRPSPPAPDWLCLPHFFPKGSSVLVTAGQCPGQLPVIGSKAGRVYCLLLFQGKCGSRDLGLVPQIPSASVTPCSRFCPLLADIFWGLSIPGLAGTQRDHYLEAERGQLAVSVDSLQRSKCDFLPEVFGLGLPWTSARYSPVLFFP